MNRHIEAFPTGCSMRPEPHIRYDGVVIDEFPRDYAPMEPIYVPVRLSKSTEWTAIKLIRDAYGATSIQIIGGHRWEADRGH
jgi:hypothetical protein